MDGRGISLTNSAALITNYYYKEHNCSWQGLKVKPGEYTLMSMYLPVTNIKPDSTSTIAVVTVNSSTEII